MKAKLIGERSAGMTAVEVYNDTDDLVWSHRWFDDGSTTSGYISGLCDALNMITQELPELIIRRWATALSESSVLQWFSLADMLGRLWAKNAADGLSGPLQDDIAFLSDIAGQHAMMMLPVEIDLAVSAIKTEILVDIAAGVVPETVKNFSELHDYRDANCYGGFCDMDVDDLDFDLIAIAQDKVNAWLSAGRK